jgi:hypothetical protein
MYPLSADFSRNSLERQLKFEFTSTRPCGPVVFLAAGLSMLLLAEVFLLLSGGAITGGKPTG